MEIIVDNFAGGGGASSGIEAALGRSVDYAINHDEEAIAMHRVNHPDTVHFCSSVWDVNPTKLARGRPVGLGWFSPDCTFHSKARGGKPFRDRNMARRRRGLANLIPRWAATPAAPRVICLENVEEFADWGPLLPDGKICPKRRGLLFRRWHRQLENLGYRIDMRELKACDYGAPTTRKRLFIVMRRDAGEIIFPDATHGHWEGAQPYRTAAECIDWSIPCPSIFERSRPLAEATLRRIARGVMRYVVNSPEPFIVGIDNKSNGPRDAWPGTDPLRTVTTENRFALVSPLIAGVGGRMGQSPERSANRPLNTITTKGDSAVVTAFLAKHYGGVTGHELQRPIGAVTTVDHHSLVTSHLLKLRRNCDGQGLREPIHTVTTGGHFGEVRAFLVAYYGNDKDGQKLG
jgi:DNA (cytosine-5)-methyltransferase 1